MRVGEEAFTYVKKARYRAMNYMNGHGIQLGGPIGRHRYMVLRLRRESAPWARRRDKVSRVPCAIVLRDTAKTASVKVVECEQTNPGSHAADPETPGGAPHGRFRAPTATDGSDENPRGGKRVKRVVRLS